MEEKGFEKLERTIENLLVKMIIRVTTNIPPDVLKAIRKAKMQETSELAKTQFELILDNFEYGCKNKVPICQDTGVLNFFIRIGNLFPIISNYRKIINKAVIRATEIIPLRGNSVHPLTNQNPENNIGLNYPPIYLDIVDGSENLKIDILAKGGGAENISKLFMLNPSNGLKEFPQKVIEVIKNASGMPCPPIILGIGIGGDATKCMLLAKKALLRPLNEKNSDRDIAKLEEKLLNKINSLNIGPMGLGGNTTCLGVNIEIAMRHPASYPVGMIVQCYCHRLSSIEISKRGEIINES
ncbi:MAG: fumarate hydratase [Candidatus Lokiarchaeota archaeon]|nr:fumarate hydratase [Candidatus Lokiarchaeota archaeon]MBD3198821.1 fumarate hydratase [Candidatus Lokiarchaeota archaeon]